MKHDYLVAAIFGVIFALYSRLPADELKNESIQVLGRLGKVGSEKNYNKVVSEDAKSSVRVARRGERTEVTADLLGVERHLTLNGLLEMREFFFFQGGVWILFSRRDPVLAKPVLLACIHQNQAHDKFYDAQLKEKEVMIRDVFGREGEFLILGISLPVPDPKTGRSLVKAKVDIALLSKANVDDWVTSK
ncbi:hypothetical protein HAHE_12000 [Haloferula helveola]|uniref:Uncharacterized protein n=1 Tax=Haloferula helveola TaxID=490095 RepID=A0ABM7RAH4_9BACT|nr:hypothetical protein HAHE_12000 [Haloferula helveola]